MEPEEPPEELLALRAGVAPSQAEASCVQAKLASTEPHLSVVEEELEVLRRSVGRLERQRKALTRRLGIWRTFLAPVRRLPVEILSRIFELACDPWCINDRLFCTPFILSAVCKRWRDVAHHDCPQMWAQVALADRRDKTAAGWCELERRLKIFLQHANGAPLRSVVTWPGIGFSGSFNDEVAWPILFPHAVQWRALNVGGIGFQGHAREADLKRLETIITDVMHLRQDYTYALYHDLPALHRLKLSNAEYSPVVPTLPWAQIDTLSTTCTSPYLQKLLPRCAAALVHWTHTTHLPNYMNHYSQSEKLNIVDMCTLTKLRDLRIRITERRDHRDCQFLRVITAPMLDSLAILWSGYQMFKPVSAETDEDLLASFVARGSPRIRRLRLEGYSNQIRDFVLGLQHLQELGLRANMMYPLDDEWLQQLSTASADYHSPVYLPRLEELALSGHLRVTGSALIRMVDARQAAGRALKVLRLDLGEADKDLLGSADALEELRRSVSFLDIRTKGAGESLVEDCIPDRSRPWEPDTLY
ncbi:hypothetical protein EV714DRAFT_267813 [Schizophyllum commune]